MGILPAACGFAGPAPRNVATLAALEKLPIATLENGQLVAVDERARGGTFRWDASSRVQPDGGTTFGSATRGRWLRVFEGAINAAWFGASPRASAALNSAALASASATINRAGGGSLLIPPGVYRVGGQRIAGRRGRGYAYAASDIIRIDDCSKTVQILGRGATLRAADGLRYGSYHPVTGESFIPKELPFTDNDFRANAYNMIYVGRCSGPVAIIGVELDGNLQGYAVGGNWGDNGIQAGASGIFLDANTGGVAIEDVYTHHHGLDGIVQRHAGLTPQSPRYPISLVRVRAEHNGRQGLSWTGGTSLLAIGCRFAHTGRTRLSSSPAAGVDMEAEGSVCRNGRFVDCQFIDNVGVGFVADSGDGANVLFERCLFVGTTNYTAWPRKPGIIFNDCEFVGTVVSVFSSADPALATRFNRCRFTTEQSKSPTGSIFNGVLADLGGGAINVLFDKCAFDAGVPTATLPWSPPQTCYRDCTFRQVGKSPSYPRGIFTGSNSIESAGPVDVAGSVIRGSLTINGRQQRGR